MQQKLIQSAAACALASIGVVTTSALGAVTLYTDQAAFDAASKTSIVVTFEEREWLPALGHNFYGSISSGGITFAPIASPPIRAPNLYVAPPEQANFCCPLASRTLTSSGGENIDLNFTSPPGAVGFVVYANAGQPIVYTLTLASGPPVVIVSTQTPSTVSFIGFTSDVPIVKLNWTSDFGDIQNAGMDDVRVGNATLSCPADLNNDGVVDAADLAILLGAWNGRGAADLNGSGSVEAADLAILLGAWGPC